MAAGNLASRLSSRALSQEAFDKFLATRRWLQSAVSGFCPRGGETEQLKPIVLLYGSAISGTAFPDGDADFAVVFSRPTSSVNSSMNDANPVEEIKRENQEIVLSDLYKHINAKTTGEPIRPQRVFRARVPIVQYLRKTDSGEDLKFDISLSLNGVMNSLLLRKYMEEYPRLRLGVMCAKQWGREAKILNARRGWISPYALTILYVNFMVTTQRIPEFLDEAGVSVNVYDALSSSVSDSSFLDRVSQMTTALEVHTVDPDLVQSDVYDFFSFYGNPSQFDFDASVVDIRKTGTIREKEEWLHTVADLAQIDRWHLLGHENIMIRDPYEPHNLGRSVDFFKGEAIREAFRVAGVKKEPLSFLANP